MNDAPPQAVVLPNATAVSLDLPNYLPFDQWLSYLTYVKTVERAWSWWLGDLLNAAERFGYFDEALQTVHEMGFADSTCSNAKSIASRIPKERRVLGLEYSHHKEVAYLEPAQADRILEMAARSHWTVEEVRQQRQLLTKVTTNGARPRCVCPTCGAEHATRRSEGD